MKLFPPRLALLAAVAWAVGVGTASAQFALPFGRDATDLTAPEVEAMEKSILEVLQSGKAGTARSWKNDGTKRSGQATLRKTYTRGSA